MEVQHQAFVGSERDKQQLQNLQSNWPYTCYDVVSKGPLITVYEICIYTYIRIYSFNICSRVSYVYIHLFIYSFIICSLISYMCVCIFVYYLLSSFLYIYIYIYSFNICSRVSYIYIFIRLLFALLFHICIFVYYLLSCFLYIYIRLIFALVFLMYIYIYLFVYYLRTAHRSWHLYRIYSIPTHDKHQWLLLLFIVLLMMDARGVRNI